MHVVNQLKKVFGKTAFPYKKIAKVEEKVEKKEDMKSAAKGAAQGGAMGRKAYQEEVIKKSKR